jgi:hypothetical protein
MCRWNRIAIVVLTLGVPAGAADPPGAAHREAMKKLSFLAGKWAGEATIQTGPGKSEHVKQTEDVEYRLGGTVQLIEGKGFGRVPGSEAEGVVFNALAVVHYDAQAKAYRMRAHRAEGMAVDPELTVTDTGFVWQFSPAKSNVRIRYTATVKDGTWTEVGEMSRDGTTWTKFLEMNLKRVNE